MFNVYLFINLIKLGFQKCSKLYPAFKTYQFLMKQFLNILSDLRCKPEPDHEKINEEQIKTLATKSIKSLSTNKRLIDYPSDCRVALDTVEFVWET